MNQTPARAGKTPLRIAEIIKKNEKEILTEWTEFQLDKENHRKDLMSEDTVRQQSKQFLQLFVQAMQNSTETTEGSAWQSVKEFLQDISRSRVKSGFSPSETAMFVFSLKKSIFDCMRQEISDTNELSENIWALTLVIDKLGLQTTEMYQKSREEVITRQQQDMMELSTPVVRLWDGVLALPLIGTLDSARTQIVMETLLQEIVDTGASIAIIDITGVPTVDTLVAQHLLKTIAAARLMGADCIISGIRPQIAQTIVHLGVELNDVITKSTLADAFTIALTRLNYVIARGSALRA